MFSGPLLLLPSERLASLASDLLLPGAAASLVPELPVCSSLLSMLALLLSAAGAACCHGSWSRNPWILAGSCCRELSGPSGVLAAVFDGSLACSTSLKAATSSSSLILVILHISISKSHLITHIESHAAKRQTCVIFL